MISVHKCLVYSSTAAVDTPSTANTIVVTMVTVTAGIAPGAAPVHSSPLAAMPSNAVHAKPAWRSHSWKNASHVERHMRKNLLWR